MKRRLIPALMAALWLAAARGAMAQPVGAPLSIGIFSDADSFPLIVAEKEGLFTAEGLQIRLVRFQSAVERDSAFQAGALQGIITDIPAVFLAAQAGFGLKITSLTDGRYGIASAPGSGISSLSQLSGKSIGISNNTVIHFMADSFLDAAGVAAGERNLVPVPKMPVRLEMLLGGQLAAAGMPEPFLTNATTRGAVLLAATDDFGLGAGVLAFSDAAIGSRGGDLAAFYRAYWKAAGRINANPEAYRSLLANTLGFSGEAAAAYRFVVYKFPRLPSEDDLAGAERWLLSKGLLKNAVAGSTVTDGRFLPAR